MIESKEKEPSNRHGIISKCTPSHWLLIISMSEEMDLKFFFLILFLFFYFFKYINPNEIRNLE